MNKELTKLYSNYLLSSFGAATATGLSDMLEGEISHDRIARFLSKDVYDSRTLWQQVKPMVRGIEQPDGALIFDDTIEEEPHTDENQIVSWHFDHSKNRTLQGINILNRVYHVQGMTLPAACEIIRKPILFEYENTVVGGDDGPSPPGAAVPGDMPLRRHPPPSEPADPSPPVRCPGRPSNQPKR